MGNAYSQAGIIDYYDQAEIDYRLVWSLKKSMAMHYGFWDKGIHTLPAALERENAVLAELADIQKSDHVLDAGCGVGGSSLFLAERIGCHVTGITLSEKQVKTARAAATKRGLSRLAKFEVADFTATKLPDASFDVVWAIESVCHAADKSDFLREAFRVLKPSGRLVIADGFMCEGKLNPQEERLMRQGLDGWSVPNFATLEDFQQQTKQVGFTDVRAEDYTAKVLPSSKRLYRLALASTPVEWLSRKLGIRSERTRSNALTARFQYIAIRQNLCRYGVVTARKP